MKICESSLQQCTTHNESSLHLSYFAASGGRSFSDILAGKAVPASEPSARDEKIAGGNETAPAKSIAKPAMSAATTTEADDSEHLRLLRLLHLLFAEMLATLDGRNCTPVDVKEAVSKIKAGREHGPTLPPFEAADWSMQRTEVRVDHEDMSYCATGTVRTADGRRIDLKVDYSLSRDSAIVTSVSSSAMDGVLKDPLVLRLGGGAILSGETLDFDLDADGARERIAAFGSGYGLLALDRNDNGKVDDGSELFGAKSGNGFADLMQYDVDHNGWIDENDPVFGQLSLWLQSGEDGKGDGRLRSLQQAGIGALSLDSAVTPFTLKRDGQIEGQLRASGIYLRENGGVDLMQQVDIKAES
ncbi:MAG: hypothetical protein EG825_02385 [Rhodocyclaceae bacterium]|nr:hypothetical protein [Rhodocyclaceae bacterium]